MEIKIKYVHDIKPLEINPKGDWIDLRVSQDVILHPNEYKLIPLGVAMELPEGYEAHIAPRSSTYKKYGIIMVNSIGVVDNSFKGDDDMWMFPALNIGGYKVTIEKNTRICQFRVVKKQPNIEFKKVDSLNNDNRGGFGSTDV